MRAQVGTVGGVGGVGFDGVGGGGVGGAGLAGGVVSVYDLEPDAFLLAAELTHKAFESMLEVRAPLTPMRHSYSS